MIHEPLVFAAISDVAGKVRGKAFPLIDLEQRLRSGIGWTPTNVQITCFDVITQSPYGSFGDLIMMPDPDTEVRVDYDDGRPAEHFILSGLQNLDGSPWECCTRHILKAALVELERVAGITVIAAFEHEFQLTTAMRPAGDAYSYIGFSDQSIFLSTLTAALREAGLDPECVMREYGADQYEVTVRPEPALAAADTAVVLRELTRTTATRCAQAATFTPIREPSGVGNGVHIHLSFRDADGRPVTYDADGIGGMSAITASFVAGVLRDLDALVALTAPSVISYTRLTPHRWSAAFNNVGVQDREAAIRICPVNEASEHSIADQFNIEFRAADAAASPHLALAAIVHAGLEGIKDRLPTPPLVDEDLSLLGTQALASRGLQRLPTSLADAIECFRRNERFANALPGDFAEIYRLHKTGEIDYVKDMNSERLYAAYGSAY